MLKIIQILILNTNEQNGHSYKAEVAPAHRWHYIHSGESKKETKTKYKLSRLPVLELSDLIVATLFLKMLVAGISTLLVVRILE